MDRLTIDVRTCDLRRPECDRLVESEYGPQSFYWRSLHALSVADIGPGWMPSKVVRYNARKCEGLGFVFRPEIDRGSWADDLHGLRASAPERQGRPMPAAYMEPQEYVHDLPPSCPRHGYYVHGVVSPGGRLVAYAQLYQCGDVARVNTFLGHADYLGDYVAWLLMLRSLEYHRDECGAEHGLYYTHDSGAGGGLRYFKERFRFRPAVVEWT